MGISGSIYTTANKIGINRSEIDNAHRGLNTECNRLPSWWRDKASEAFIEKYKELNATIKQLDRETYNLTRTLAELATTVDRVDEKRRIAMLQKDKGDSKHGNRYK